MTVIKFLAVLYAVEYYIYYITTVNNRLVTFTHYGLHLPIMSYLSCINCCQSHENSHDDDKNVIFQDPYYSMQLTKQIMQLQGIVISSGRSYLVTAM